MHIVRAFVAVGTEVVVLDNLASGYRDMSLEDEARSALSVLKARGEDDESHADVGTTRESAAAAADTSPSDII